MMHIYSTKSTPGAMTKRTVEEGQWFVPRAFDSGSLSLPYHYLSAASTIWQLPNPVRIRHGRRMCSGHWQCFAISGL
jgi:hypothetical protein